MACGLLVISAPARSDRPRNAAVPKIRFMGSSFFAPSIPRLAADRCAGFEAYIGFGKHGSQEKRVRFWWDCGEITKTLAGLSGCWRVIRCTRFPEILTSNFYKHV